MSSKPVTTQTMTSTNTQIVGLISDIHANLPALEAVFDDIPQVDVLVHAGDVVGYGPWPNMCIEHLRKHQAQSIRGNHDAAIFRDQIFESGDRYAAQMLTDEHRDWLKSLPTTLTLADEQIKVVHGHPADPFRYTPQSEFTADLLGDEQILVLGHTHQQAKTRFENGIIVNPGSVGQPRDGDARAAYAVVDLSALEVELVRVPYDIDRVAAKIEETSISKQNATRLYEGT